jgi:hypothetical protein
LSRAVVFMFAVFIGAATTTAARRERPAMTFVSAVSAEESPARPHVFTVRGDDAMKAAGGLG